MSWRATIGLEIHVQLDTASKLFCSCPTAEADRPNRHTCAVCLGHPGVLPRLNGKAMQQAVTAVMALGMQRAEEMRFDRKHYVYPDLAKSWQTSQFYATLGRGGTVAFDVRGRMVTVRLREAHLEEDAAKLQHGGDESMVDFNRAGTPLLEVVTEPDLHIGEEAEALLRHMQLLMRTVGASQAQPELGQMRCDVNISVSRRRDELGTRVEIKNLNSPRFVRLAIEHEIERQTGILEAGGQIKQETRTWNENRGVTAGMRSKEMVHDYRYLAEPDLAVVELSGPTFEALRDGLPELPEARRRRFVDEYGLSRTTARELVADPATADFFETCARACGDGPLAADWVLNQMRELHRVRNGDFGTPLVPAERLAELLQLLKAETVSASNAKALLAQLPDEVGDVGELVRRKGLGQISDRATIESWVAEAVGANERAVQSFRDGKAQAFQFLVGQVLRLSRGAANPRMVRAEMQAALGCRRVTVIDMGGAITATCDAEGSLGPSSDAAIEQQLEPLRKAMPEVRFDTVTITHELSENLTPREWFDLWRALHEAVDGGSSQGVVVTHGLDTMAYTASLMRWLLPSANVPVVFTGSAMGPHEEDSDASRNLKDAVELACRDDGGGCWVQLGGRTLPAVNVQMVGLGTNCLTSRNLPDDPARLVRAGGHRLEPDRAALEGVVERTVLLKVYPGLDPELYRPALTTSPRFVLLELFDTGTGNARWGARGSLLPLVRGVVEAGGAVFCTSQQGVPVDMDRFESSRSLWDAGVVPLGRLVTESAYTKLLAAQLVAADRDAVVRLMTDEEFAL